MISSSLTISLTSCKIKLKTSHTAPYSLLREQSVFFLFLDQIRSLPGDGDVIAGAGAGCFVPCQAWPVMVGIFRSALDQLIITRPAVQLGLITGGILNIL